MSWSDDEERAIFEQKSGALLEASSVLLDRGTELGAKGAQLMDRELELIEREAVLLADVDRVLEAAGPLLAAWDGESDRLEVRAERLRAIVERARRALAARRR